MLARVRLESLTGEPLRLYVLADPAPGDDGNDDRAVSRRHRLAAWDDDAASVIAATPALRQPAAGIAGGAATRGGNCGATGASATTTPAVRATSCRAP